MHCTDTVTQFIMFSLNFYAYITTVTLFANANIFVQKIIRMSTLKMPVGTRCICKKQWCIKYDFIKCREIETKIKERFYLDYFNAKFKDKLIFC